MKGTNGGCEYPLCFSAFLWHFWPLPDDLFANPAYGIQLSSRPTTAPPGSASHIVGLFHVDVRGFRPSLPDADRQLDTCCNGFVVFLCAGSHYFSCCGARLPGHSSCHKFLLALMRGKRSARSL